MKNYKKILLLLIGILIVIGTTYALDIWKAGGGVKWIGETDQTNRFEDYSNNTSNYGTGYYLDTYTGLKWQAIDTTLKGSSDAEKNSRKWGALIAPDKPIWNGDNYSYPSGYTESDFPAFKHCTDIGDGWRLPTSNEIFSIMTDTKPSGMNYMTNLPSINYNKYITSNYWGGTTCGDISYGDFNGGVFILGGDGDTSSAYTICIHD